MKSIVLFALFTSFVMNMNVSASCEKSLKGISVTPPNPVITERLQALLPKNTMLIPKQRADELASHFGISVEQLMVELVPVVKTRAQPPISKYLVGAVGRATQTGNLILLVRLI